MFRFVEASKEWKERGTGDVRFLRHKENKKIRVLMRAEKTLRVRANHPCKYMVIYHAFVSHIINPRKCTDLRDWSASESSVNELPGA
jgi:hypothetical protein